MSTRPLSSSRCSLLAPSLLRLAARRPPQLNRRKPKIENLKPKTVRMSAVDAAEAPSGLTADIHDRLVSRQACMHA